MPEINFKINYLTNYYIAPDKMEYPHNNFLISQ